MDILAKELNAEITRQRIGQIIEDDGSFSNFTKISIDI